MRGLRVRLGAALAVAVALGFIVWAAVGGGGGGGSKPQPSGATGMASPPVALSLEGLRTLATTLRQPIYWVGTRQDATYELQQTSSGNVFLRYLPTGVKAGDPTARLTVGTYPLRNAFAITQGLSEGSGSVPIQVGNGIGFSSGSNSHDAYLAFAGVDYQVEVYSPVAGEARRLVERGAVTLVPGSGAQGEVSAVTAAGLASLAAKLGQTVYWAGPESGVTYEVRRTPAGVYVRYLPKGVAVGDPGRYRTVATYPLPNAYAVTSALGKQSGNTTLELQGGGVAVYERAKPTSVYVAFRGADYQIEVFDPKPGAARTLVASNGITGVR